MSSTLADSNLVLEKIGHIELTPEQKAEAEKACREIKIMIEKAARENRNFHEDLPECSQASRSRGK